MSPRMDAIGIVVADMAASLAFYRLLGLETPAAPEGEDHVEVDLGALRLMWDTRAMVEGFDPSWTPPTGGHAIALAFLCDSPAEVDETVQAVRSAGFAVHLEPWDAFWGQRYATVVDPDGNHVDLFAPLA